MADYWKSQPKKFCEICKCWFADNKISVQHHENGMRHKNNVRAKIREIGRKGRERDQEMAETRNYLAQMEKGALASFRSDLRHQPQLADLYAHNTANSAIKAASRSTLTQEQFYPTPAPTSKMWGPRVPPQTAGSGPTPKPVFTPYTPDWDELIRAHTQPPTFIPPPPPDPAPSSDSDAPPPEPKLWAETVTEDGFSYYWHLETGETIWEAPSEGFMSLAEQEDLIQEERKIEAKRRREEEDAALGRPNTLAEIMAAVQDSQQEPTLNFVSVARAAPVASVGPAPPEGETCRFVEPQPEEVQEEEEGADTHEQEDAPEAAPEEEEATKGPPVLSRGQALLEKKLAEMRQAQADAAPHKLEPPPAEETNKAEIVWKTEEPVVASPKRPTPYGDWTPVVQQDKPKFKLPQQWNVLPPAGEKVEKKEVVKEINFKEKTVASVLAKKTTAGAAAPAVGFRKRKLGDGARNLRTRDD